MARNNTNTTNEAVITEETVVEETVEAVEETVVEETAKEKMVKIKLPLTKSEKNDVAVAVNDRTWLIKRGCEVEVPECVAEVLQHQEEMLSQAMAFDEAHADKN